MRAPPRTWIISLAILGLMLTGCGRGEVKHLRLSQAGLQDQIQSQDRRIDTLEGEVEDLRQQKTFLESEIESLQLQQEAQSSPDTDEMALPDDRAAEAKPLTEQENTVDPAPVAALPAQDAHSAGEVEVLDDVTAIEAPGAPAPQVDMPVADAPAADESSHAASPPAPQFAIHLASYRRLDQVKRNWPRLRENFPKLLGDLEPRVVQLELEGLGGLYYRLKAGPFASRDAAGERCERFKAMGEYCVVSAFDGMSLDESS